MCWFGILCKLSQYSYFMAWCMSCKAWKLDWLSQPGYVNHGKEKILPRKSSWRSPSMPSTCGKVDGILGDLQVDFWGSFKIMLLVKVHSQLIWNIFAMLMVIQIVKKSNSFFLVYFHLWMKNNKKTSMQGNRTEKILILFPLHLCCFYFQIKVNQGIQIVSDNSTFFSFPPTTSVIYSFKPALTWRRVWEIWMLAW